MNQMPKLYKEGEIVPSETNEHYKLNMRGYRARKCRDKQVYWSVIIEGKAYIFIILRKVFDNRC